jgi:hypothetical protein
MNKKVVTVIILAVIALGIVYLYSFGPLANRGQVVQPNPESLKPTAGQVPTYTPPVAPTVTTQAATDVAATSCTGNGNITDTGGENPSERGIQVLEDNFPSAKVTVDTATYDAFGVAVRTGIDSIIYFYCQSASGAGSKGKIVRRTYVPSLDSWSAATDVYDDPDPDNDCRNVAGGIIGNSMFVFFARLDIPSWTFVDLGYMKSTDLTCTSWGPYTTISTAPITAFSPYGRLAETSVAGTYLQSWYGTEAGVAYLKVFKTTDYGATWSIGATIGTAYAEPSLTYIGGGKLIALIRDEDGYVAQSVSSDDGDTWSAVAATNLGLSSGCKVTEIIYDSVSGHVIAFYLDRGAGMCKVSESDAATVFASPVAWNYPIVFDSGVSGGYPSAVKISNTKYLVVYYMHVGGPDAGIWQYIYGRSYFELDPFGVGAFTESLTDLMPSTNYYCRAFAINSAGIGYGSTQPFTTLSGAGGANRGSIVSKFVAASWTGL